MTRRLDGTAYAALEPTHHPTVENASDGDFRLLRSAARRTAVATGSARFRDCHVAARGHNLDRVEIEIADVEVYFLHHLHPYAYAAKIDDFSMVHKSKLSTMTTNV